MPLVPTRDLVAAAAGRQTGVAAFNVITLEHAEAIAAGAEAARQAVILQISQNAVAFHQGRLAAITAAARAVAAAATVPVSLHLDHVTSEELLRQAPEHGYSSVMYDTSKLSYADNVAAVSSACRFARRHGLWLEAELGTVAGKDGQPPPPPHAPGARTDPEQAAAYVAATGVDGLAVAVGSSHAMTEQTAALDQRLIAALHAAVPVPLVLHGSSGVSGPQLRAAISNGITKVNIGTALNIAYTAALRRHFSHADGSVDPRRYLARARDAVASTVTELITLLTDAEHEMI